MYKDYFVKSSLESKLKVFLKDYFGYLTKTVCYGQMNVQFGQQTLLLLLSQVSFALFPGKLFMFMIDI